MTGDSREILSFCRIAHLFFRPLDSLVQKAETYRPDGQELFLVSDNNNFLRKLSASLIHFLLALRNRKIYIRIKGVTHGALALLSSYPWPDNVHELKNVLEHAIIFTENNLDRLGKPAGNDV